jgi:hypothetical protein
VGPAWEGRPRVVYNCALVYIPTRSACSAAGACAWFLSRVYVTLHRRCYKLHDDKFDRGEKATSCRQHMDERGMGSQQNRVGSVIRHTSGNQLRSIHVAIAWQHGPERSIELLDIEAGRPQRWTLVVFVACARIWPTQQVQWKCAQWRRRSTRAGSEV